MEFVSFGVGCHDLRPSPLFSFIVIPRPIFSPSCTLTLLPLRPILSLFFPSVFLSFGKFLCSFVHFFSRTADVLITNITSKNEKKTKHVTQYTMRECLASYSGSGLRSFALTETACLSDQLQQHTESNSSQQQRPLIFLLRS